MIVPIPVEAIKPPQVQIMQESEIIEEEEDEEQEGEVKKEVDDKTSPTKLPMMPHSKAGKTLTSQHAVKPKGGNHSPYLVLFGVTLVICVFPTVFSHCAVY